MKKIVYLLSFVMLLGVGGMVQGQVANHEMHDGTKDFEDIDVDTTQYIEYRHSQGGMYYVKVMDREANQVPIMVVQNGDTLAIGIYSNRGRMQYGLDDTESMVRLYGAVNVWELCGINMDTINLSHSPSLKGIDLGNNSLSSIDLSGNTALESLNLMEDNLSEIDVSNNVNLQYLNVYGNNLRVLDVSNCSDLEFLICPGNELESLTFPNGADKMESVECSDNELTELNVENLPNLKILNCSKNHLEDLNLEGNAILQILVAYTNNLNDIRFGSMDSLNMIECYGNGFGTEWYDRLYCKLPTAGEWGGTIDCGDDTTALWGTNGENLRAKNWSLIMDVGAGFEEDMTDRATGDFDCSSVGIDDFETMCGLKVWPNPVVNECKVRVDGVEGNLRVDLVDINGRVVKSKKMMGGEELNISAEGLNGGVYLLRVMGNSWCEVRKLIVK